MKRRNLLTAGLAVVVVTGAAAVPVVAVSSPILDAGRQLAALDRQHEQADVPGGSDEVLGAIWEQVWAQERFILDAAPATIAEAMVVLMVAAGNLDMASTLDNSGATVDRAMHAAARATRFLAGAAGVTVEEFGGGLYLPNSVALSSAVGVSSRRAARALRLTPTTAGLPRCWPAIRWRAGCWNLRAPCRQTNGLPSSDAGSGSRRGCRLRKRRR